MAAFYVVPEAKTELAFRKNPVQLLDVGRLGKVVVETGFLKGPPIRLGPITRNGDELGIADLGNFPQLSCELITVHVG